MFQIVLTAVGIIWWARQRLLTLLAALGAIGVVFISQPADGTGYAPAPI
jgi:hypothetical protein